MKTPAFLFYEASWLPAIARQLHFLGQVHLFSQKLASKAFLHLA